MTTYRKHKRGRAKGKTYQFHQTVGSARGVDFTNARDKYTNEAGKIRDARGREAVKAREKFGRETVKARNAFFSGKMTPAEKRAAKREARRIVRREAGGYVF